MLAARTGEINRNKGVRSIFLFDWNLNAAGIATNWDKEGIENFVCFNRDPGDPGNGAFVVRTAVSPGTNGSARCSIWKLVSFSTGSSAGSSPVTGCLVADKWRSNPRGS